MGNEKIVAALVLVSFVLLIVTVTLFLEHSRADKIDPTELEKMGKNDIISLVVERQSRSSMPPYYFVPLMGFVGVVVGTVAYHILGGKIELKQEAAKSNTTILLKLLDPPERKAVQKLVENGGKVQQLELSRLPDLNKVKTHRILRGLEAKGVIHKERYGKVNLIVLEKGIYEALKD